MKVRQGTGPILALDSGSPLVSVAVAAGGEVLASRCLPQRSSSRELLPALDEVLAEGGLTLGDLGGLIGLAGPGSFTGLRVGLATLLGLHQATGLPAATLPTLEVLAAAAPEGVARVVAAIDARRGEWVIQAYGGDPRQPLGPSRRCTKEEISSFSREVWPGADATPPVLVGFGVSGSEPPPLAAVAALLSFRREISWDPACLTRPLYFRPPAVTVKAP